jgi:pSer/pThr/pTyr-binding forkhead associated (FHA) protein
VETLHGPSATIGRDPSCEFLVADETVSARHALLSYHHAQWWLEDLGSRNGTRLNQVAVQAPTALARGDQIRCGDALLVVHLGHSLRDAPAPKAEARR